MGKIEKLQRSKTISFKENKISYFECINEYSNLTDYSFIINKIKNANKSIKLFSSSDILSEIIESLYMNEIVHTYIILSSFEKYKNTLDRFDNKKPIIIREVLNVVNNFIIIDNVSYLFVNPLSMTKNLILEIEEIETKELDYIFNYYFWNKATKEKLVNNISDPIESPFPPFELRIQKHINISNSNLDNCADIYIPKDKKYNKQLEMASENKYFSSDIQNVIEKNIDSIKIGNIVIQNTSFVIYNAWILKSNKLSDIDNNINIIPKNDDWNKTINIIDNKIIELEDIEALSIEDMNKTEAKEFIEEQYVKSITYNWQVLVPKKVNNSVKSFLYNDFKKLEEDFNIELDSLENNIDSIINESGLIASFLGTNRKAKNNLKEIQKYKDIKLSTLSSIKLNIFINEDFKNLQSLVLESSKDFKYDKERKKAEDIWKEQKEQKNKTLVKKQNELKEEHIILTDLKIKSEEKIELKKEINLLLENIKKNKKDKKDNKLSEIDLKKKRDEYNKIDDKEKNQSKLSKSINQLENSIQNLEKDVMKNYEKFNYKIKTNEISQLSKKKTAIPKSLTIPKYILPELGSLYETKNAYYLEITKRSDLEKANELAKRYTDKQEFKVVVGEYNE